MFRNHVALSALFILVLTGCKTREDIAREKLVQNMSMQMEDSQQLNADFTVRLQNIEDRLSSISGQVEEGQHETKKTLDGRLKTLEEKISLIETTQSEQSKEIEELKAQGKAQAEYIKDVLSNLKTISKKSAVKKNLSPYQAAMSDYKRGRYDKAKGQLLDLLNGKMVSGGQKARVIHNLGMIAYMDKENDKALAYFSRLFTEYPKTGYNKNGLLYLAKTLQRLNKNNEAKQALNELITRFPKARQIKDAKKMLGKL